MRSVFEAPNTTGALGLYGHVLFDPYDPDLCAAFRSANHRHFNDEEPCETAYAELVAIVDRHLILATGGLPSEID